MTATDYQYWPFAVDENDRQLPEVIEKINFLERVYSAGFKGYRFGINNYGAKSSVRAGIILERGRRRWEFRLSQGGDRKVSAFVTDFEAAGRAVVTWLHDYSVSDILENTKERLVIPPGLNESYKIYQDPVP